MHHLGGARRQFFNHFAAGAAQQDRFESFAQMVQIFVAQQLASFVHHLVAVEEPERRSQAPLVDELHYGVKFIQPVFQRRAGEHQCKCRFKPLDDATGFGFPVLDALSFVQDDQIPGHRFYSQNIPQHLLIIAYGKKNARRRTVPAGLYGFPGPPGVVLIDLQGGEIGPRCTDGPKSIYNAISKKSFGPIFLLDPGFKSSTYKLMPAV
jgi:hypothetical protein